MLTWTDVNAFDPRASVVPAKGDTDLRGGVPHCACIHGEAIEYNITQGTKLTRPLVCDMEYMLSSYVY